jgi:hypothetical protein
MKQPEYSDFEANELLHHALSIALGMLNNDTGFPPFCLAVTVSGKRLNKIVDTSIETDPAVLASSLRAAICRDCASLQYRCVAFTRNVMVADDLEKPEDAIEVTIQQLGATHTTCYLPYRRVNGRPVPGEIYATEPVESFFPADPQEDPSGPPDHE